MLAKCDTSQVTFSLPVRSLPSWSSFLRFWSRLMASALVAHTNTQKSKTQQRCIWLQIPSPFLLLLTTLLNYISSIPLSPIKTYLSTPHSFLRFPCVVVDIMDRLFVSSKISESTRNKLILSPSICWTKFCRNSYKTWFLPLDRTAYVKSLYKL